MAEPEEIITLPEENFFRVITLKVKKCLVTAGPTYEAIDPVRFIGNHSSGKMGFAIAEELYSKVRRLQLYVDPSSRSNKILKELKLTHVTTAEEMYDACISLI